MISLGLKFDGVAYTHEAVLVEKELGVSFSSTWCTSEKQHTTLPPRSRTVCAAERPDKPPPTTMTFDDMTASLLLWLRWEGVKGEL